MARINIEDCWWTDPRRSALIRLVGDEAKADGCAMRAWRLAQEFWKHERHLVPLELFQTLDGAEQLLKSGLAEKRDNGIYIRGSSSYLEWIHEKREAGRRGGKKSAKRPRDVRGRLQKTSKQTPSTHQAEVQAEPKHVQPSYSSSSSFSGSEIQNQEQKSVCSDVERKRSSAAAVEELRGDGIVEEALKQISEKTQRIWLATYPDPPWIQFEIKKALAWQEVNPKRRPKRFARFMGSWLSRGWEEHRKKVTTLPVRKSIVEMVQSAP